MSRTADNVLFGRPAQFSLLDGVFDSKY